MKIESMKTSTRVYLMEKALIKAIEALKFYGDLRYSYKMGFPPECQWIAENTIEEIKTILPEIDIQKNNESH